MIGPNVDYAQGYLLGFSGVGTHMAGQYDPASGSRAVGKLDITTVVRRLDDGVMFAANHSVGYFRDTGEVTIGAAGALAEPLLVGIASGIDVSFVADGTNVQAIVTLGALATGTYEAAVYFDGKGFFL